MRYCGRSHSPYTLECSHGGDKWENRAKASMMRTAVRGKRAELINYGQVQPTAQPWSNNQTGTLASSLSQSTALWTEQHWTALSLSCLYYTTNFGQPDGDIGLPRWLSGKKVSLKCWRLRKHEFDSWVGKIPWRRKWQLTPIFLLENPMDRGV